MEEEIKKLHSVYDKLKMEHDELAKRNEVVLVNNKQLEDQLREEKFLTQEAEEVGEKETERERERGGGREGGRLGECSLAGPTCTVCMYVHV